MNDTSLDRRGFLAGASLSAVAVASGTPARAATDSTSDAFTYEVQRSLSEWLGLLSEEEFRVMRLGGTEVPHSSETWNETRAGTYSCKGCDLTLYDSEWKVELTKGWAFFRHARADTMLMSIDTKLSGEMVAEMGGRGAQIEGHCRRCGSHIGHILWVEREVLHCVNGSALIFEPEPDET